MSRDTEADLLAKGWTKEVRARCEALCDGDPPCYVLHHKTSDCPVMLSPCAACLEDCG